MWNIAQNTIKEMVRSKYLYMILFFAVILILLSISLGKISIGEDTTIIVDFGLAMIEVFGLLGVLFSGSQMLFKEIEGKTIFLILSKPIKRETFLGGKVLGFSLVIFCIVLFQALAFLTLLHVKGIPIDSIILWSLFHIFLKLEITLALVLFLSTFMSNMLSIISTFLLYFISHSYSIVVESIERSGDQVMILIGKIVGILLPPFEYLNTKNLVFSVGDIPSSFFWQNTLYGIIYFSVLLLGTILVFRRKKFES